MKVIMRNFCLRQVRSGGLGGEVKMMDHLKCKECLVALITKYTWTTLFPFRISHCKSIFLVVCIAAFETSTCHTYVGKDITVCGRDIGLINDMGR